MVRNSVRVQTWCIESMYDVEEFRANLLLGREQLMCGRPPCGLWDPSRWLLRPRGQAVWVWGDDEIGLQEEGGGGEYGGKVLGRVAWWGFILVGRAVFQWRVGIWRWQSPSIWGCCCWRWWWWVRSALARPMVSITTRSASWRRSGSFAITSVVTPPIKRAEWELALEYDIYQWLLELCYQCSWVSKEEVRKSVCHLMRWLAH